MKLVATLTLGVALTAVAAPSQAQEFLTGDHRLACEAVLCLATGQRPNECAPSLQRYFSIRFRKPGDTLRERVNFLKLCPASNQSPQMASLVSAMGAGAGACDATALNAALQGLQSANDGSSRIAISNELPAACRSYTQNAYVDHASLAIRYIGIPDRGGYWIEAARWEQAQSQWLAQIASEDKAAKDQAAATLGLQSVLPSQSGY
ncbi:TrbM/KikA/MpfK family conjugal transfer protein [Variovorax sp. RHLX14]|uniref:TrbM/KikA/MpfK family conjugal transfer protein n=1 Tax=Variovorax sp. RHLX14 TaxID=1259731 RepID=UPI003F47A13A